MKEKIEITSGNAEIEANPSIGVVESCHPTFQQESKQDVKTTVSTTNGATVTTASGPPTPSSSAVSASDPTTSTSTEGMHSSNDAKNAHKRTPAQREQDLADIEMLHLDGYSQAEIAVKVSQKGPYKISREQVRYDLKTIWERRQKDFAISAAEHRAIFLARWEKVYQEASKAWEKSKEKTRIVRQTRVFKQTAMGEETPCETTNSMVEKSGCGDPRYLAIMAKLNDNFARLLGLDQTQSEGKNHVAPEDSAGSEKNNGTA